MGGVIKPIDSTINYGLFFIFKWFPQGETVKESAILIRTPQINEEKIYNSKTTDLSRDTVRLATQGQTLAAELR